MISNLLILAALIFIIAFVVSYKNATIGIILYILAVPLMHKELFSLGMWDLLPIRLIAGGIILSTGVRALLWLKRQKQIKYSRLFNKYVANDPFLILLLLLWLIRAISIVNSGNLARSIALFGFYSAVVGVYLVYRQELLRLKNKFFEKIVYLYMLLGVLTGAFAVYQFIMRLCCRTTVGAVWVVPGYTPRLGSTFWDVNHYGGFLITLIPLFFAQIFILKKKYQKILVTLATVFLIGLLFLTKSRSAWIGLGLGVSLTGIIYYWNHLKKPIISAIIAVVLGSMLLLGYTAYSGISVRDKVARFTHARLDSTDTHFMLLEGASEIFFDNIYIGSGYGNFDESFRQTETANDYFDREPILRTMKVPPHSVWGEVLAETGGVGIILYALFSLLILGSVIQTVFISKSNNKKYLGIGILGSLSSIFSAGLFYSYNMEFYWVVIFMAIGYVLLNAGKGWNVGSFLQWWYDVRLTPYLIIVPPALFLLFLKLGSTTLIDWDEAIYAKVAKNIAQSGEWLSLRWDDMEGYWFEKPPLYMWLTALAFKVTNFNSYGARIVSATFGFLGILLTYKFGEKLYNKLVGIFSALILLSTIHYLYYSRNGMLDVTATFFIVATVMLFYLGRKNSENSGKYYVAAGAALGLGMMTKAVVGLIPIPIIGLYLLFDKVLNKKAFEFGKLFKLGVAFLLVAAPWHVYSIVVHGQGFIGDYFLEHIFERGLSGFGHEKPVWWFLEVIKVSFRIWLFPFVAGLLWLPFKDRRKWNETVLLGISILVVLVFFSVSKDKLLWYIMPIYPFMAIVSARFIERFLSWFNSVLKREVAFDYQVARSIGVFVLLVVAIFHVIFVRDRVYYPDFNRDKVALININNELYPIEIYPQRKLYYSKIQPPVLHFYSDHKIKATSHEDILRRIDEAEPAQNYSFLIPAGMYYGLRGEQDKISAPLVLEIKGAAGEWMLIKSRSRVELLSGELTELNNFIAPLKQKALLGTIADLERAKLDQLITRKVEVVAKLTKYGYLPESEKVTK